MDSNGDGIGDLQGLISKLDYIKKLGTDVIWLNPIYVSPLDDNGYDIADYYNINPMYGTMEDFDELVAKMHDRGLKLLMDLVVNHCSDDHQWFQEARKSKDNPYRDFFFWKDGVNGGPPNNWVSFFGGSAWEYNQPTDDYFLHIFTKRQPDLNWENPNVREEVYKAMRFWLDKGIDGFRMDVISLISKHLDFPNSPSLKLSHFVDHLYANGPRIHEFLQEMNQEVLSHYDAMTVGEGPGINDQNAIDYVGANRKELNMIFQLEHMFIDWGEGGKFDPIDISLVDLKDYYKRWNEVFDQNGWITSFLDNHDFPRLVSRFGNDREFRIESAKLLATLILTMPGTPCIYYGSEIAMTNVAFDSIDDYRDVETLNFYREFKARGVSDDDFLKIVHRVGRDNVRTPMQWDDTPNAGFSTGNPWIKLNPNYQDINVQNDLDQQDSIYAFYQRCIALRKQNPCLTHGTYQDLAPEHANLFTYRRSWQGTTIDIALNFSNHPIAYQQTSSNVIMTNYSIQGEPDTLRPWEARVMIIDK